MTMVTIDPSAPYVPLEIFHVYFSPHSAHAIRLDTGEIFPTMEHAYQASKFGCSDIRDKIRLQRSPLLAWLTAKEYENQRIAETRYEAAKLSSMASLIRLKVQQHNDVRAVLRESGSVPILKIITTYPPADPFWCVMPDGSGANHYGRLWMEEREVIRDRA